ncbi:MAG: FHA domain-containing protein [Bacteriovoracaceae bacterium]
MNDIKTEMFIPEFYLVSKKTKIKLSGEGTIGRSKGDILINDVMLSSLHCKYLVKGTKLFITDLKSTNGIYLNSERVEPDLEIELNLGDKVRLGSNEYVLFDEEQSIAPNEEIQSLSWKEIFSLKNLNSSYGTTKWWRFLYVMMLFFPALMLEWSYALETKLLFLSPLIDGSQERNLGLFIVSGFILATIHAYDAKYRKRGMFLKSVFYCSFFLFNFFISIAIQTAFIDYEIRQYLEERDLILRNKKRPEPTPSKSFVRHFNNIKTHLSEKDAKAFAQDYAEVLQLTKSKPNLNVSRTDSCQLVSDLAKSDEMRVSQVRTKILESVKDNKFVCPESLNKYFVDNKGSADEGISGFLAELYLLNAPMVLDWVSKDDDLKGKLEFGLTNAFYEQRNLSAEELSLAFVGRHPEVIKQGHQYFDLAHELQASVIQSIQESKGE